MRVLFSVVLCLCLLNTAAAFDDDPFTPWSAQQACVSAPTAAPADWTYPGAVLIYGYSGIHASRAEWGTIPRVVAFFSPDVRGHEPLDGGQMSPDSRWYAMPMGEHYTEFSYNQYSVVYGVRLYSTANDRAVIDVLFSEVGDEGYTYTPSPRSYLLIEWQDNETLFVGNLVIRPFASVAQIASFDTTRHTPYERIFSPDLSRVFEERSGFYAVDSRSTSFHILPAQEGIAWQRDSQGFISEYTDRANRWDGLAYFDRDGTFVERVLYLRGDDVDFRRTVTGRSDARWSPDNRYFAFIKTSQYDPTRLFIADRETQTVLDTCLNALSDPVWSPDGTMLAFLARVGSSVGVIALDLGRGAAYQIGYHNGEVGQFGAPVMMGWRDPAQ